MWQRYPYLLTRYRTVLVWAVLLVSAWSACTKEEEPSPMEKVKLYLTGTGNRFWKIQELYTNGVKVALTTAQMGYNKTYTTFSTNPENTGTFADSDGYKGSWILTDVNHISETIENNPGGPVKTTLTIREIGPYKLDVEYIANGQSTRTVYFAN